MVSSNSSSSKIQSKVIMVLGLTGTGKTLLINYLNGIEFINIKDRGSKKLKPINGTLPGGFKIGHSKSSETLYPAVYTPPNADYSYIDNPGFQDTHGVEFEIAAAFFRRQITDHIQSMKFLVLLTGFDLTNEKGSKFRSTIKSFTNFLSIFREETTPQNEKILKKLGKSICIVVTKAEFDEDDDDYNKTINNFKDHLKEVLSTDFKRDLISKSEKMVFDEAIQNVGMLSNPRKNGSLLGSQHKDYILNKINKKIEYVNKSLIKPQLNIDSTYESILSSYTNKRFEGLCQIIERLLNKKITKLYYSTLKNYQNETIVEKNIKIMKHFLKNAFPKQINFEKFLNQTSVNELLDEKERDEYQSKFKTLNFLNQVLLKENQINEERAYVSNDLKITIDNLNVNLYSKLATFIKKKFENLKETVQLIINLNINKYYNAEIINANSTADLNQIENKLTQFVNFNEIKEYEFNEFLDKIDSTFLDNIEKQQLLNDNYNEISLFIKLIDDKLIQIKHKWIDFSSLQKIRSLIKEINYFKSTESYASFQGDDSFVYNGYFSTMTDVLEKINKLQKKFVKVIRIHTTHSFLIDADFKLPIDVYESHSPNMIIISPKISISHNLTIDLSSEKVPSYPHGISTASSGRNQGDNGMDGKAGLPGFSAGNLLLISDNTIDSNLPLNFISKGGRGGPGQSGN
jgi:hypothetical protein